MKSTNFLKLTTMCLLALSSSASELRGGAGLETSATQTGTRKSDRFGDVRFMHTSAKVGGAPSVGSVTTREGLGENVPYPGSEFIGVGYDALIGNPNGDGQSVKDPGFKAPVLRFGYCQEDKCLTRDMVHLRPMESNWQSSPTFWPMVWARPEASCERSKKARTMFTMSDYSKSLSVDASVSASGGFFGASVEFSASAGVDQFKREIEETGSQKYSVKSYCILYSIGFAQYRENLNAVWDPVMKAELDALPSPGNSNSPRTECASTNKCFSYSDWMKWLKFFRTFGTHYVYDVKLGGKFVVDVTVKEDSSDISKSEATRASIEASFDGFGASGSLSLNTASSSTSQNSLKSKEKQVSVSILGGTPPSESSDIMSSEAFGEWAATVAANPMPVQYKLAPISNDDKFKTAAALYGQKYGKPMDRSSGIRWPYRAPTSMLTVGEKLYPTQSLVSANKAASLTLSETGRLELHRGATLVWHSGSSCSGEFCSPDTYAALTFNCTFIIYENGDDKWTSNNRNCIAPDIVYLQDDVNLVTYDSKGASAWSTRTHSNNVQTGSSAHKGFNS